MAAYSAESDWCSARDTEGVNYFTNILHYYFKPVPYWRLSGHLGQASEELVNYIRKTYPNDQFIQFFQNNSDVFYVDFDGNVSLRDLGETIEFFENILNCHSEPIPCWRLQGHLGQAKIIVFNYMRTTYSRKFIDFFINNSVAFKVDNYGNVSLNSIRKDAVKFFVSVLRCHLQSVPYWKLHGHLSHAPIELRNYMKNTYPLSRFLDFFKNNFTDFYVDTQSNVSLRNQMIDCIKERKAVKYFISIFKSKYSNPVPYWKLRGHLGQASNDLIDYIKMTYPQNSFLKFFESNDIFFHVDDSGSVSLKPDIHRTVNKGEDTSSNSRLNIDMYILNEKQVNIQTKSMEMENSLFDISSFIIPCKNKTTENNETKDEVELEHKISSKFASETYIKPKDNTPVATEKNFIIEENIFSTNKCEKNCQVSSKTENKIVCNQTKKHEISSKAKNQTHLQLKISSEIGNKISFVHHQVSTGNEILSEEGNRNKMFSEKNKIPIQRNSFIKNNTEFSLQNTNEANCNEISNLSYLEFQNEMFNKIKRNSNVMQMRASYSKQLSSTFVEAKSKIWRDSTDEVFITEDLNLVQVNDSSLNTGHLFESNGETCINNIGVSCPCDINIELKAIEYFKRILAKYSKPVPYQKLHHHLSEATEDVIGYMSQNFPLSHPKFIDFFQNNAVFNVDTNGNISVNSTKSEEYNQCTEQSLNDLLVDAIECFNDTLRKYFERNLNWSCVIL